MKLSTEDVGQVTVVVLDIDILDAGNAKEFKADMSPILERVRSLRRVPRWYSI
jgi:hypothetical protein